MKRWLKHARHAIEAAGFFTLIGVFRVLGVDRASALGGWLARRIGPSLPLTRRARKNLDLCFPDMSAMDKARIIADMYDNLGRSVAEIAHLDKFAAFSPENRIALEHPEHIDRAAAAGKGAIFISAHFANWELIASIVRRRGCAGAAVFRATNNPLVGKWLHRWREKHIYSPQVPKGRQGARQLLQILHDKNCVATMVDQKMNDGIAVPFFGHDAMTAPAPAQLALRFGCPIVPISLRRVGGAHFAARAYPPITAALTGNRTSDMKAILVAINGWLEDRIREEPSQWLWLHKRWPTAVYHSDPAG